MKRKRNRRPKKAVTEGLLRIPSSEFSERMKKVRERMREEGFHALLVYSFKSNAIRYLSNYSPRYSVTNSALMVLPLEAEPVIFTRLPMHLEEAKRASYVKDVRVSVSASLNVASTEQMAADCRDVLKGAGAEEGKLGLIGYGPEMGISLALRNALPRARIVDANYVLEELRIIKSKNELAMIRRAAEIADEAYEAALDAIRERKVDYEVFAASEFAMRKNGALGTQTFFGICEADKVFLQPTGERIKEGAVYFLETIPEYEGYWPERTGNVAVGKFSDSWGKIFKIVEDLYDQSLGVIRPGITVAELVKRTSEFAHRAGLERLSYRLGHGIGLDNIERPEFLSETDETTIRPGMVFAIHPTISIPGVGSAHVGGTFIVNDSGADPLSRLEPRIPRL